MSSCCHASISIIQTIITSPLLTFNDGRPLTRSMFVEAVKRAFLDTAGVDSSQYSGHSFRSGAATTATTKGDW